MDDHKIFCSSSLIGQPNIEAAAHAEGFLEHSTSKHYTRFNAISVSCSVFNWGILLWCRYTESRDRECTWSPSVPDMPWHAQYGKWTSYGIWGWFNFNTLFFKFMVPCIVFQYKYIQRDATVLSWILFQELYMFWAFTMPIIRSTLLHRQPLV
jgi:hypothetical protein